MKYFSTLLVLLFLTGCSPLTHINFQVSRNLQAVRDIPYGEAEHQVLDIYTRRDVPSQGVVVFVHGGYWDSGDKSDYPFLADSLTEQGFTTVVVNYRLVPTATFPSYVEDVTLAVKWTLQNVTEYGGNPENTFLMGHSAGAHIAALVAFDERYLEGIELPPSTLDGFIGLAGPYDFLPIDPNDLRAKAALGPEENYADTQPINFVDGTEAPAFLGYTLKDDIVNPNNTVRFAERIREAGGRVEERIYDGVDHITLLGAMGRASRFLNLAVLDDSITFLENEILTP